MILKKLIWLYLALYLYVSLDNMISFIISCGIIIIGVIILSGFVITLLINITDGFEYENSEKSFYVYFASLLLYAIILICISEIMSSSNADYTPIKIIKDIVDFFYF